MTDQTNLDDLVESYLELTERIEFLDEQRSAIKAKLADLGVGSHKSTHGVTVSISAPPRRFNAQTALRMLTPEQVDACMAPSDALIKRQLPPALLDACMDEGAGAPRVSIR